MSTSYRDILLLPTEPFGLNCEKQTVNGKKHHRIPAQRILFMLKMFSYFLWAIFLFALIFGFDLWMMNIPLEAPGLKQTQAFYVDFRKRLFGLFDGEQEAPKKDAIEQVIENSTAPPASQANTANRYLYVDENGALQFADSLEQVPQKFRKDAKPLAE